MPTLGRRIRLARSWTDNQLTAITSRNQDVCVVAGAGSGKTGVLVERFVRIVREGVRPDGAQTQVSGGEPLAGSAVDRILVITFTEKATKEMKGRIVAELMESGLVEERREVETAYISTIHGFCARLLKENPFEAGVDPEFSVLDENEALRRFRAAVDDAVERAFMEGDDEIIELVVATQDEWVFGQDNADPLAALASSVRAALGQIRGAGWRLEMLRDRLSEGDLPEASTRARAVLRASILDLSAIKKTFLSSTAGVMGSLAAIRQEVARRLDEIRYPDTDCSWDAICRIASEMSELSKAAQKGLRARGNPTGPEMELQAMLTRIKASADQASCLRLIEAENEELAMHMAARFSLLLVRSWERYELLKREDGSLDNDDLQSEAVDLLRGNPGVLERYRRQFRHLLVDEFQDTNPLQMDLINLLHQEAANDLFIVGDSQQSIYSFRHADPSIFQDIQRHCHVSPPTKSDNPPNVHTARARFANRALLVPLAVNFRSRPEILAFINGIFSQIWSRARTPFMPLEEPIGASLAGSPENVSEPAVEILIARNPGRQQYIPMEAAAIARRVHELTSDGQYRHRDIALLLRVLTDVEKYERAFFEAGIPYYIVGGGRGYFARFEIRDILNLFTVLENPLTDLAVACTLRSPLVGVSADTLYRLASFRKSGSGKGDSTGDNAEPAGDKQTSLFMTLSAFAEDGDAEEGERVRISQFVDVIQRARELRSRYPVSYLLEFIIAETNLDARLLVRPNGRRRLANMRKLLAMAYDAPSQTVGEFMRRLREIEKLTEREGDAPTEEEASDVVRILTIHKAKGLEFPVVFLGDMSRRVGGREQGAFVCDGKSMGIGCKMGSYKDFTYNGISEEKQRAEQEESFRVLYVGLTRARERLVLCGSTPSANSKGENWSDAVFPTAGVLGPPDTPERRIGPNGVIMRVSSM